MRGYEQAQLTVTPLENSQEARERRQTESSNLNCGYGTSSRSHHLPDRLSYPLLPDTAAAVARSVCCMSPALQ